MALFSIKNGKAKKIPSTELGREKNIQKIFEDNLNEILDTIFLETEYPTSNERIDTLGIDDKGKPVIIEYKRSQNDNVTSQGIGYMNWLIDHKSEFKDLVRKKSKVNIDWTSPRIICVAKNYSKHDIKAYAGDRSFHQGVELWKFCMHENNILLVESITKQKVDRPSPSKVSAKGKKKKASKEKEVRYTLKHHLGKASPKAKKFFKAINGKILALDKSISREPTKNYIAYKLATNFVDIEVQGYALKISLNVPSGKLNDPYGIARDLTKPKKVGSHGNGDYEVKLENEEKIKQVFSLIKQSYKYNKLKIKLATKQKVDRPSPSKVSTKGKKEKASKGEARRYKLEDHLSGKNQKVRKIFNEINKKIRALDASIIKREPKKDYIAYKLATNFVDIVVYKSFLQIYLNMPSGTLNDPDGIFQDLTKPKKIAHWGNGDYRVNLKDEEKIEQIFPFIKQSYTYRK